MKWRDLDSFSALCKRLLLQQKIVITAAILLTNFLLQQLVVPIR